MNNFGLGLILNFTDNASSGLLGAATILRQLQEAAENATDSAARLEERMFAMGLTMNIVGDSMANAGSSILGVFTQLGQRVLDTGQTMNNFRMQLNALYNTDTDTTLGDKKMKEIQQYAATSVFEIEGLISSITMMKAVGIEAMDDITTSSGNNTQKLMDYASDLAAMIPNMRNAYGTGVSAAMGAIKEYVAEGNARSLKSGAGLDITELLGQDKGKTIEERKQQIADLIEQLGIVGYTKNLFGTPTQQLSNFSDYLFNFLSEIADSGAFDSFCALLTEVSELIGDLVGDTERYNVVVEILGDVITTLMEPLHAVVRFIRENIDAILDWVAANPKLVKTIALATAGLGAFLLLGGKVLSFSGQLLMLVTAFKEFKTVGSIFGVIRAGFLNLFKSILPLVALAGILYAAWKTNLFGFRDLVQGTFGQLGTIVSLVFDALSDNALSMENYELAEKLGLLRFLESLMDIKYHFGFFVEGFKTGVESILTFLSGLWDGFANTDSWLYDLCAAVGEFLKQFVDVGNGSTEKWREIGELIGKIVPIVISLYSAFKVFSTVVGVIQKVGSALTKLWNTGKAVYNFFAKNPFMTFITGVVMAVTSFVDMFTNGFNIVKEAIMLVGIALAALGAILLSPFLAAHAVVVAIIAGIVAVIATVVIVVKEHWQEICDFFAGVGDWFMTNVITPVADFFKGLWDGIVKGVTSVVNAIKTFFSTIASWIYNNVIAPVVGFFMNYIYPFIEKIAEIVSKIIEIVVTLVRVGIQYVMGIVQTIVGWINTNIIQPIANFFVGLWNTIVTGVTMFVGTVQSIISTIVGWISTNIITPIATFFSNLWNGIVTGVTNFITAVQTIFSTIVGWIDTNIITPIADFFTSLWEKIQFAFNTVADTITGVLKGAVNTVFGFIGGIINGVIRGINTAIDVINAIPGVSISKITELSVPQLAKGGVAKESVVAEIGEGKDTEAVLPLNDKVFASIGNGIVKALTNMPSDNSGNEGKTVESVFDYKKFADAQAPVVVNVTSPAVNVAPSNPVVTSPVGNASAVPSMVVGNAPVEPVINLVPANPVVTNVNNNTGVEKALASTTKNLAQYSHTPVTPVAGGQGATEENYDYSVTFSAGAIVIQAGNMSNAELEKAAEKLMKIIERKQKLKKMAQRNTAVTV